MERPAMSVLAIDTSSRRRTVVVIASASGALARSDVRTDAPVGTALPQAIAALIEPGVDAVVVVTGPGSYTGLRAGMAAALGVAQARALPLHGLGTLDVVAAGHSPGGVARAWVAADAGRGAMYIAMCEADSGRWRVGAPRRVAIAGFDTDGLTVASADALPLRDVSDVDPAAALALAVPEALRGPPIDPDGLRAVYVE
jgi:tRNA threonylcarbamoyl adenosine modification protein YeaZ